MITHSKIQLGTTERFLGLRVYQLILESCLLQHESRIGGRELRVGVKF